MRHGLLASSAPRVVRQPIHPHVRQLVHARHALAGGAIEPVAADVPGGIASSALDEELKGTDTAQVGRVAQQVADRILSENLEEGGRSNEGEGIEEDRLWCDEVKQSNAVEERGVIWLCAKQTNAAEERRRVGVAWSRRDP